MQGHQEIRKKLRHMSTNKTKLTCTLRSITTTGSTSQTMEIYGYGFHHGPSRVRKQQRNPGSY